MNNTGNLNNTPFARSPWDNTVLNFQDYKKFEQFIEESKKIFGTPTLSTANANFSDFINIELSLITSNASSPYGMYGKHPRTYQEAIDRNSFIYWEEYKSLKKSLFNDIKKIIEKNSVAEITKPQMVFNDRQIGEFIYDRAARALEPEIFFYSPSKNRVVDLSKEKIYFKEDKIYLESDNSLVIRAMKIEKPDGTIEYLESVDDESIKKASEKGIVSVTSTNKKVYLYKQKLPKEYKAIKIMVALSSGGFTAWNNDFYTGMAAVLLVEVLESLDYSVELVVALGGGRCEYCPLKLMMNGRLKHGRRYILVKLKEFGEFADMDKLLYMLCDPSFHNVKFVGMLNTLYTIYGDQLDTNPNPSGTWHAIEEQDCIHPLGDVLKAQDIANNNRGLLYYYLWRIKDANEILYKVTNIALLADTYNIEALKKAEQYGKYTI